MHPITIYNPYCIDVSLQRECTVVHSQSRQRLDVPILPLVGKFRRAGANNGRGRTLRRTTCVRGGPSMGPTPHPAVQAVASSTTARMASADLVSAFRGVQVERYHAADPPGVYNVAPCLIAIDIYPVSILYSSQAVLIDRLEENEVHTAVGLLWSG